MLCQNSFANCGKTCRCTWKSHWICCWALLGPSTELSGPSADILPPAKLAKFDWKSSKGKGKHQRMEDSSKLEDENDDLQSAGSSSASGSQSVPFSGNWIRGHVSVCIHVFFSSLHFLPSSFTSVIQMPLSVEADWDRQHCEWHSTFVTKPFVTLFYYNADHLHFPATTTSAIVVGNSTPLSSVSHYPCKVELSMSSLPHTPALIQMQQFLLCQRSECTPTSSSLTSLYAHTASGYESCMPLNGIQSSHQQSLYVRRDRC